MMRLNKIFMKRQKEMNGYYHDFCLDNLRLVNFVKIEKELWERFEKGRE